MRAMFHEHTVGVSEEAASRVHGRGATAYPLHWLAAGASVLAPLTLHALCDSMGWCAQVVARDAGDPSTRELLHQGAATAGAELLPLQAALQPQAWPLPLPGGPNDA